MNDYDKTGRYYIKRDSEGFLQWFLKNHEIEFRAWIDSRRLALPDQKDLTNDLVAALSLGDILEAMIVEIAAEAGPRNLNQALEYLVRLKTEPGDERSLVFSCIGASILNLTGKHSSDGMTMQSQITTASFLNLGVHQLDLCDVQAESFLSDVAAGEISPWQLGWVPLMQGGADSSIIKQWRSQAERLVTDERRRAERLVTDERRRTELGFIVLIFATLAKCRPSWEQALRRWNMKTCEFLDEIRAEGRQEGLQTLILRLGKKKFGKAASKKQQQDFAGIQEIERLESLAERLIDVSSWTELLNGH